MWYKSMSTNKDNCAWYSKKIKKLLNKVANVTEDFVGSKIADKTTSTNKNMIHKYLQVNKKKKVN